MAIRLAWVDHLKALAICLVVYGHSYGVDWGIGHWIYAFHLPLFFVLSGFLESDKSLSLSFKDFCWKQFRTLLIPYAIFAVIGYVAWAAVLRHMGADSDSVTTPLYQPLLATLYGSGTRDDFHMMPLVLWFLPCLLIAKLLVYVFAKLNPVFSWILSFTFAGLGFLIPTTVVLPMEIEDALVVQIFVYLGLSLRRMQWIDRVVYPAVIGIILIALGTLLAFWNSPIDIRVSKYGNPIIFLIAGASISYGLILAAKQLLTKGNMISNRLSQHTILIFPLHTLVFSAFNAVYVFLLNWDISMRSHPIVALVATVINITLLLLIAPLARKWLPWIYGAQRRT